MGPTGRFPCWDRSVLYRAYCVPCRNKGINAEYIGETGKSIFQRSPTHYQAFRYRRTPSFMLRHCMQSHPLEDPEDSRFGWEVLSKEPTCLRRQVSEALRIRESRQKENRQRELITKQFTEETNQQKPAPEPNSLYKNPGTGPKPSHKPRSEPEPEPESEPESELDESESESESESEPESETGTGTKSKMAKQKSTIIRSKQKKTKPTPPPEEYIIPKLTHINLNDKLEYNRSTIPFPDDKPPTEELKKSEGKIRS